MIQIDARNIKVLEDFFDEQPTHDQRGFFIASYRKAVKPLVLAMKAGAPIGKKRRLVSSIGTMDAKNEIAILVGAMRPKGAAGHLITGGTVERSYITKRGKTHRTGKMTANDFMKTAYEATEAQIFNTATEEWYDQIGKAIDKTNNKMR
jgi:hypothetical protein